jgi:hypothetical protein
MIKIMRIRCVGHMAYKEGKEMDKKRGKKS